jgi:8-oxo-dGTP pyrophosphatase MutT (NUDIX family)
VSSAAVLALDRLDTRFEERVWPWAEANREAVTAHWGALTAARSGLYNGRVLLALQHAFEGGVFRAVYSPVDYAAFIAWRDFGFPDPSPANGFAMAALRAADGSYVAGVMGAHTANAGKIYFAAGTPDLSDVTADGRVDLEGSVARELTEETGLDPAEVSFAPGWTAILDERRIALMKETRSPLSGPELVTRIEGWLATQDRPELAGVVRLASVADLANPRLMPFMRTYLGRAFGQG